MAHNVSGNILPTELRTERLVLRTADMDNEADNAKVNYIRSNVSGGPTHHIMPGPDAARQLRYKQKVHGPRQELCTLAAVPKHIYWLVWLPCADETDYQGDDFTNLVGFIGCSFRQEMPIPDIGYTTVAAHAGHGYAAEAGREVLHYWRDLVGVREIFVGCGEDNLASQRCAERIGFVRGGTMIFEMGSPPNVEVEPAIAYVLPGMQWKEGQVARPVKGWSVEDELE